MFVLTQFIEQSNYHLANFQRLVLGSMDADVWKCIFVAKLLPRFIRFACELRNYIPLHPTGFKNSAKLMFVNNVDYLLNILFTIVQEIQNCFGVFVTISAETSPNLFCFFARGLPEFHRLSRRLRRKTKI